MFLKLKIKGKKKKKNQISLMFLRYVRINAQESNTLG